LNKIPKMGKDVLSNEKGDSQGSLIYRRELRSVPALEGTVLLRGMGAIGPRGN